MSVGSASSFLRLGFYKFQEIDTFREFVIILKIFDFDSLLNYQNFISFDKRYYSSVKQIMLKIKAGKNDVTLVLSDRRDDVITPLLCQ